MREKIDPEQCEYLFGELPVLVLALTHTYPMTPAREWRVIGHQTAGLMCHQHYYFATVLEPRPECWDGFHRLTEKWVDSQVSSRMFSIDTLLEYRADLKVFLSVDCNITFWLLEEALYPIDCTAASLQTLTAETLPSTLDDLIDFQDAHPLDRLVGSIGRWELLILGDNSD